jgi:hypothetical protein
MSEFTRGATIRITAVFKDVTGQVVTPSAAKIWLKFQTLAGEQSIDAAVMTLIDQNFYYEWDSRNALCGIVTFHVRTDDGVPYAAKDGSFRLVGDKANPD